MKGDATYSLPFSLSSRAAPSLWEKGVRGDEAGFGELDGLGMRYRLLILQPDVFF